MIRRIQIKNFKCYGEPGVDFSLKRINFIFGDNSVGKSTFLQLIRMVFNGETDEIENNFRKYVFCGDESRQIKMRITTFGQKKDAEDSVKDRIGKTVDWGDLGIPIIDETGLGLSNVDITDVWSPVYEYSKVQNNRGSLKYIGWVSGYETINGDHGRIRKEGTTFKEVDVEFRDRSDCWIPHVIHSEAARPQKRIDVGSSVKSSLKENESVLLGSDAVEYVGHFFNSLNVPYSCVDRNTLLDKAFGVRVDRYNLGAGIDGLYETALKLYEWRNSNKTEAIAGCAKATGCALLALEEPESHVNERQISPLMDFIFKEAKEIVNGQIVIECHSELMALKLKNFLRAGLIFPDELAVFFATKTESGTVIEEIPMDEKGNFRKKWPGGGFFTERTKIVDEFFKAKASK